MPYKKKAKKNNPKKFDHKHVPEPCVIEYVSPRLDRGYGFVPTPAATIRNYCPICGKICSPKYDRWWQDLPYGKYIRQSKTEEHLRELNPETRTLPTFHLDGQIWDFKFVDLTEANSKE